MEKGIYKAIKYRLYELYDPLMFTSNFQAWLAILAFSLFIVVELSRGIYGWWSGVLKLDLIGWIAYILGSATLIFFLAISVWALMSLMILIYRGFKGIAIEYDPKTIPPEIRKAIEPINVVRHIKERTMEESDEIKALNTYYETANSEYDRILTYFDQLDNKVGFLIAVVVGIPIATIGFAAQLTKGDVNCVAVVLGGLGVIAFLGAGWSIVKALWTRNVKLGIPYDKFNAYSKEYNDDDMKEWVAAMLMKSSEVNYKMALQKAKYLQRVLPCLLFEVVFFTAGIIYVLATKL